MEFTLDLRQLDPETRGKVIQRLAHEDAAQHDLGLVEQARLREFHQQMADARQLNTENFRQVMVLSPSQQHAFRRVYGQLCWADPDFAKWVAKQPQHADLVLPDVGTKVQSGYTGKTYVGARSR